MTDVTIRFRTNWSRRKLELMRNEILSSLSVRGAPCASWEEGAPEKPEATRPEVIHLGCGQCDKAFTMAGFEGGYPGWYAEKFEKCSVSGHGRAGVAKVRPGRIELPEGCVIGQPTMFHGICNGTITPASQKALEATSGLVEASPDEEDGALDKVLETRGYGDQAEEPAVLGG